MPTGRQELALQDSKSLRSIPETITPSFEIENGFEKAR
jgi:hypothetical protein